MDDKIVATITYRSPKVKSKNEYYNQPTVASFGQFAVEPELQQAGIGSKLMELAESLAARDKATEIAFDTAEGAADLIAYYTKRGYSFVDYTQWDLTNYRSVIMRKRVEEQM